MSTDRATTDSEAVPTQWTALDELFFTLVGDLLSTDFLWGAATLLASYDPEDAPAVTGPARPSRAARTAGPMGRCPSSSQDPGITSPCRHRFRRGRSSREASRESWCCRPTQRGWSGDAWWRIVSQNDEQVPVAGLVTVATRAAPEQEHSFGMHQRDDAFHCRL